MDSKTCHFCGHEVSGLYCPVCKARVAPPAPAFEMEESAKRAPAGSRAGLWLVAGVALVALVGVAFLLKSRAGAANGTTAFAELIRNSQQFKTPVTLKASRQQLPRAGGNFALATRDVPAGVASPAVYVLEAQGLIAITTNTSESRIGGDTSLASGKVFQGFVTKSGYLDIQLTERGRQEAAGWEAIEEPYHSAGVGGAQPVAWWRIPVGSHEVVRLGKAGTVKKEIGKETLDVEFFWRWQPNEIGAAFDTTGAAFAALPEKARQSAASIRMSSREEHRGVAHMERYAGDWKLVTVDFTPDKHNLFNSFNPY
ncbi:MAG: hypothetical protein H7Z38_16760 [Rubrivivax sp.]|nr:hypothetical protein [Pyrinomonadaceae bacterium]